MGEHDSRPALTWLAVLLACVVVSHLGLLRFSLILDETYFALAARDFFTTGRLIPFLVIPESHPPLVYLWLALCWKFMGFGILTARLGMLAVTLLYVTAIYALGRIVCGEPVALAASALTALYPVVFMHSTMVHLDMAAAAFTSWASSHISGEIPGVRRVCFPQQL